MAKCPKCKFEFRKDGGCLCSDRGKPFNYIPDIPEHYNRGIGKVIRGRRQYEAELKANNLIEVGNEKNYISPEYNEKLQEKKTNDYFKKADVDAYRYLGEPTWN